MSEMSKNIQNHSTKQPAMLTDMLSCICVLTSKHLFIYPIKNQKKKKNELNGLNKLNTLKHPLR